MSADRRTAATTQAPTVDFPAVPHGMSVRRLVPDDIDALLDIAARIGAAHGRPPVVSRADLEADFASPDLDLERDTLVVLHAHGALALATFAYLSRPGRPWLDPVIDPDLDDDLVAALLDTALTWGIDRAFDDLSERPRDSATLAAGGLRGEWRLFDAYARAGLQHARTYWRMERTLDAADRSPHLDVPEGVTLHNVDPEDPAVMQRLHQVDEESFAEHHGFVPVEREVYDREVRFGSGYDRQGCWLAQRDGEDVAVMILNDSRAEDHLGWVAVLGVVPDARGHGIARALLRQAFAVYQERGRARVGLSVDSINPTGATRLYESVGMTVVEIAEQYELALSTASDPADERSDGDDLG